MMPKEKMFKKANWVVSREALAKWDYNKSMFYTYILRSRKDKSYYIGSTGDLKNRINVHNQKGSKYSSSKTPFDLVWYSAFMTKDKALEFEKYLKSSSGFAFRNKRLI